MLTQLFDISYIISTYGYLGIFTIVFLESGIFFALPGDTLLFTAGLLTSVLGLNIYLLILIIFLGTFLGGIIGYEIGVHLNRLRRFAFFRRILKEEHLKRTRKFFDKHGRVTIILSRFVPIVRTFTPIVAGITRMNYHLFVKYSLYGSVLWSTFMTLLGYFLGQVFPSIKDYLFVMVILIVLVSVLPIIYEVILENKKNKN